VVAQASLGLLSRDGTDLPHRNQAG
jgi:hypothetical protein